MISYTRDFLLGLLNDVSSLENQYQNKFSGRCFIIGNGPSISKQNLNLLKDEYTFVTNRFILHPNAIQIKPSFYCISDPVFLKKSENKILDAVIKETINGHINNIFVSNRFKLNRNFTQISPLDLTHYIYMIKSKNIYSEKQLSVDAKKGFFYASTVILDICIPLAYYMGFETIYLLGCESDYSNKNTHFYGSVEQVKMKAKDLSRDNWFKMINTSYDYARKKFEENGREIIDCSENGKLTTLPKAEYSLIV